MKYLILAAVLLLPCYSVSGQAISPTLDLYLESSDYVGYSYKLDELRTDIESMSGPLSETALVRQASESNHSQTEMSVRKRRMWMFVGINAGALVAKQLADRSERRTGRCGAVILSCRGEKIGSMIIGAWIGAGISYVFTHRE